MKQLICERDICEKAKQGVKQIVVDENTMITAAAEDAALASGIEIVRPGETGSCACVDTVSSATASTRGTVSADDGQIDPELVYRAVSVMAESGALKGIVDAGTCGGSHCNCSGH